MQALLLSLLAATGRLSISSGNPSGCLCQPASIDDELLLISHATDELADYGNLLAQLGPWLAQICLTSGIVRSREFQ
jgi:hypothetical protein